MWRRQSAPWGVDSPLMVMKGDDGATGIDAFRIRPIPTILSGPAASVAGALLCMKMINWMFVVLPARRLLRKQDPAMPEDDQLDVRGGWRHPHQHMRDPPWQARVPVRRCTRSPPGPAGAPSGRHLLDARAQRWPLKGCVSRRPTLPSAGAVRGAPPQGAPCTANGMG